MLTRGAAILLLVSILAFLALPGYAAIPIEEREALIDLYNSTDGDNWANNSGWKTPPLEADGFALRGTEHTWRGITVTSDHVAEIRLEKNKLNGTLPAKLGNLSHLQWLTLYKNQLSGSIPPELGNLSSLEYLYLLGNQLSGAIPRELANFTRLSSLYLNNNQLSGKIPPQLGDLSRLCFLLLYNNHLSGSIPPELSSITYLRGLDLSSNRLRGEIPTGLAELFDLETVDISYNALYSHDSNVIDFLNEKNPGWFETQTIAPTDVTAAAVNYGSIELSWTPILYTADPGLYRVFLAANPGGPYTFYQSTADKFASSMVVSGLKGGKTYYFAIKTKTDPHANNANTVKSGYSSEASATTGSPFIVTAPTEGESFTFGSEITIAWTCSGITGDVKIVLKRLDTMKTYVISEAVPYNSSPVNYRVLCGVKPGNYAAVVKKPGVGYGVSGQFTISGTCINVTSPAGGENYAAGEQIPVNWTTSGITGDVRIILKRTDKTDSYVIAPAVPYNSAPFNYTVPADIPAGSYFIRIKKVGVISGRSSDFTIN